MFSLALLGPETKRAGSRRPAMLLYLDLRRLAAPVVSLPPAGVPAAAASLPTSATATTTAASRRPAFAVAVIAVDRTARRWLKRELSDVYSAIGALQVEMTYVDQLAFSEAHSFSSCEHALPGARLPGEIRIAEP